MQLQLVSQALGHKAQESIRCGCESESNKVNKKVQTGITVGDNTSHLVAKRELHGGVSQYVQ